MEGNRFMAELWDVYDKDRKLTGRTVERGAKLREEDYHLVVQVWIRNAKGQWLISRRAETKSQPLKWEPTGGSVLAGETSLQGALREVKEELGISLDAEKAEFFRSFRRDKEASWENPGFLDVWVFGAEIPISDVVLQEEETCDAKWAEKEEIIRMIEQDDMFVPMRQFPYYKELLKKY